MLLVLKNPQGSICSIWTLTPRTSSGYLVGNNSNCHLNHDGFSSISEFNLEFSYNDSDSKWYLNNLSNTVDIRINNENINHVTQISLNEQTSITMNNDFMLIAIPQEADLSHFPIDITERKTTEILRNIWKLVDELGQAVMGQLWRTVYLTIQDAIPQGSAERCALSILLQVPSWIGKLIIGKDYSGFDICLKTETVWSVNFYACSIIVGSGFCLWTVLGGRIIIRLWKDLRDLF